MKSYVSVEQKQCPICGIVHDTGLLLDRRMRESLERFTLTGAALCGECQGKYDEGYIALVEVDPAQSPEGDTLKMEDAYRTGRIARIRKNLWPEIFDSPCPDMPMVFAEDEVISMLMAKMEGASLAAQDLAAAGGSDPNLEVPDDRR